MKKRLLEFPLACCAAFGVCWSAVEGGASTAFAVEAPYLTRVGETFSAPNFLALGLDANAAAPLVDVVIAPTQYGGGPLQQAARRTFGITRGAMGGERNAKQVSSAPAPAWAPAPAPVPAPAKTESAIAQEAVEANAPADDAAKQTQEAAEAAAKQAQEAAVEQAAERSAEEKTRALTGDQADAPDARVDLPEVDPAELAPTEETKSDAPATRADRKSVV